MSVGGFADLAGQVAERDRAPLTGARSPGEAAMRKMAAEQEAIRPGPNLSGVCRVSG